ncbi:MAG TPA: YceI family protein [Steroidobacteraceae bacterium]|nr:YceI family protein [Steroidobacteraceae bacterium]
MSRAAQAVGSRVLLVGVVLWGLAGCQTSPPAAPPVAPGNPAELAIPAGARVFKVVPAESLLQILVYRGGAMAKLGHNHVVASHQLSGAVYATEDPTATRFEIRFPVTELTIDEPELRAAAGPDFPAGVPQNAREGTHTNMLSEALLDGEQYPEIRLRATGIRSAGDGEHYDAEVEVTIKGQSHLLRVPFTAKWQTDELRASGEFPLKQSELGLKPFSIAMGALVVLDQMQVRFRLTARQ